MKVLQSGKISNRAQFWPEPDIGRICKKRPDSAGAGAELRYSPNSIYNS